MVAPGVSKARLADIERSLYAEQDNKRAKRADVQLCDVQAGNAAAMVGPDAKQRDLCALAVRRAELMMDRIAQAPDMSPRDLLDWLNDQMPALQGRPLRINKRAEPAQQRRGLIGRATCKDWWTRALRRAATDQREALGRSTARVCASREQYITNETMRRKMAQDEANAAMLAGTELENEDGEVMTLAQLSAASVSNPALRRGELMTRINGCEEWADATGMVCLFTTKTTPSRFHAVHRHGGINAKWEEAGRPTVKAGQQWLCKTWARTRAELHRRGIGVFGFRVAEPHHDGTPHWHGLLWLDPKHVARAAAIMRRQWLKDAGDEAGAKQHRMKVKRLDKGGASGYVAKYIAKGIDDEGAVGLEGHDDEIQGRMVRMDQQDMFGGGARRVKAWASAHGIRQFQAIGQPPVMVWRELRRITPDDAATMTASMQAMWQAAQRDGERKAAWNHYMQWQGGAFCGRKYRAEVAHEDAIRAGRYETATEPKPVGIRDRWARADDAVTRSNRKEWRPRGAWSVEHGQRVLAGVRAGVSDTGGAAASAVRIRWPECGDRLERCDSALKQGRQAAQPWTRVNNCTDGASTLTKKPSTLTKKPGELTARERHPWAFADDWRAAYEEHRKSVMREGQNHTKAGGRAPPQRVSKPPQGSHASTHAGGALHHGQGFPEN